MDEMANLLNGYVSVCNEALLKNKERFPFKQILGAAREREAGQLIEVVVDQANPEDVYVFGIEDDKIIVMPHTECEECTCVRTWNPSKDYIDNVLADPETYINNPALIDWNWMYDIQP